MKKSLKKKTEFIKKLLRKYFPEINLNIQENSQGIWFPLPEGFSSSYVEKKLEEKGMKVANGEKFFFQKNQKQYIRIAHLNSTEEDLKNLFLELKNVLNKAPEKKEHKIALII
jgi:DNA-binding transcriptional MocR family regulator